jgi:UDP-N-acetylmuramoyl-tripeptide--D-alanyl-D-alanine ligase
MISLPISKIAEIVEGKLLNIAHPNELVNQIPELDSRKVDESHFFVALKGEHVDGHEYSESAILAGAKFVLASREVSSPSILVADVTMALAKLATFLRSQLIGMKVIAITGSQGKTTTKDLAAHILQSVGESVANIGSLNNDLGVPLTLLRCNENTKYCIVEMGARHLGDIARLMEIASPDIGVALVVGNAHLGEFGSRADIAEAKSEIISGLAEGSTAILGTYDEFTPRMADGLKLKVLTFGESSGCDVRASDQEFREGRAHFDLVTEQGRTAVGLQLLGMHQVANALAAAAIATALEIPLETIAAALSTAEATSKWRMALMEEDELLLINDSYNSNPESAAAALRTLVLLAQERGGETWAILGRMQELGASSASEHQRIGKLASDIGVDHLVAIGTRDYLNSDSSGAMVEHYFEKNEQALEIVAHLSPGDVVLVKASRSEEFEKLANSIVQTWRDQRDKKVENEVESAEQ